MTVDLVVNGWGKSGASEPIPDVPPHSWLQHLGLDRTHRSQKGIGIPPVVESNEIAQGLVHSVVRGGAEGSLDPGSRGVLVLGLLRSPARRSGGSPRARLHDRFRADTSNKVSERPLNLNRRNVRDCDRLHLDDSLQHIDIVGFSRSPKPLHQRCAKMIEAAVGCPDELLSAVQGEPVLQLALHQFQVSVSQAFSDPTRSRRRLGLAEGLNLRFARVDPLGQPPAHSALDGHRRQV
mmetsp:Transcript_24028/g.58358  ORF Transcript_24028/g.58358 Transcript_24028/m.58358 type:complete len:236 (-) Transcript_24028:183-890(-)